MKSNLCTLNWVGFMVRFSNQPNSWPFGGMEVCWISGMDLGFIGHLLLATRSLLFKPHLGSLGINEKWRWPKTCPRKKNTSKDYMLKKRWFAKKWKDFGKIRLVALCWSFQPMFFLKTRGITLGCFASWEVYFWYAVVYSCTFLPTGTYPKTIGKYRFF